MRTTGKNILIDFQKVFETSPDLYLLLSPDLYIIDASDSYLSATLTSRADIVGRHVFDVFPDDPDDPHADGVLNLHASLSEVLKTRRPHPMAMQKYDIKTPEGPFEIRYWLPLNSPVLGPDGEVQCIIHRVEDVTELERIKKDAALQQQQNEELEQAGKQHIMRMRASEERFHMIFNLVPVALLMADAEAGRLIHVNRAFEQMFQVKGEGAVGKTIFDLKITADAKRVEHILQLQQRKGVVLETELDLQTASGETKKILSAIEAIEMEGKPCVLVALLDITERKRMEGSIRALNKELEAFSYSVSHDLRAPLRAVTGYARMMLEDHGDRLDSEGKRLLDTISSNAERMGMLIDDLLTFSRLGRKEVQKKDEDLSLIVKEAIAELSRTARHHASIECSVLPVLKLDRNLVKQVLLNLVGNAVKYSSKKEHPVVTIDATETGDEVTVGIHDNGVGFDMRYAHKLFGVFQRLHSYDEFEGSGVGLAIVHRIVQKHGGKVWADSRVGQGSSFYFTLPKK